MLQPCFEIFSFRVIVNGKAFLKSGNLLHLLFGLLSQKPFTFPIHSMILLFALTAQASKHWSLIKSLHGKDNLQIYVYHHVRKDAAKAIGFSSLERWLFLKPQELPCWTFYAWMNSLLCCSTFIFRPKLRTSESPFRYNCARDPEFGRHQQCQPCWKQPICGYRNT